MKRQLQKIISRARRTRLPTQLARLIRFSANRLRRRDPHGLHLTIGLLIIVISCWWFGGVAEDILTNDPLVAIDKQLTEWMEKHAVGSVTAIMLDVTFLGSVLFITAASLVTAIVLAVRRSWFLLSTLALASGGGSLLNLLVKQIFHRERPVFENPLVYLESYSFPSGHTMGATIFYGLLTVFLFHSVSRWRWRVLAVVIVTLLIALIGVSRIYLGAHFLSDVLGAMAIGLAWLSFSVTVVEVVRRRRRDLKLRAEKSHDSEAK